MENVSSHQIKKIYTGCPTNMLTSSDQILQFSNPHVSKSKTDFEKSFQMTS